MCSYDFSILKFAFERVIVGRLFNTDNVGNKAVMKEDEKLIAVILCLFEWLKYTDVAFCVQADFLLSARSCTLISLWTSLRKKRRPS